MVRSHALSDALYTQLRGIAQRHFASQDNHTLQPTALVHEAFMKLAATDPEKFNDVSHFTAVAITAMRQIMVDHARAKMAQKRGGLQRQQVTLTGLADLSAHSVVDVLSLDTALTQLAALSTRQAKAVELRFFGGLIIAEIAEVLEVSIPTVERDLRRAKAWLRVALDT